MFRRRATHGIVVRIDDVPTDLHRKLKARAAAEGISVRDYVVRVIRAAVERPSRQELLDRLSAQPRVRLRESPAAVIRSFRDGR